MNFKDDLWKLHQISSVSLIVFSHHMQWQSTQNSLLPFILYEQIHEIVPYLSALHTFET